MHSDKHKNMAMIALAAVILASANLAVWMAVRQGFMAPVGNSMLWTGFIVLNAASILWAVSLLGLQPVVVSLSYVAGGLLAYRGVQGIGSVSVAEVTTAGATYGAFGALAVGNATAKVRLAFYNRKQVPFVFIIAALLVMDAVLNSGISQAGGNVLLNAVVFPFVLAGVMIGLIWSVLVRVGIGRKPVLSTVSREEAQAEESGDAQVEKEERNALMIQIPDDVEDRDEPELIEALDEEEPVVEELPAAEIRKSAKAEPPADEDFFPLEIDKDDDFIMPAETLGLDEIEEAAAVDAGAPFAMDDFDTQLYESGELENLDDLVSAVAVEEQLASTDVDPERPDEEAAELPCPVPEKKPAPEQGRSNDWLSGHLDLLSKLK